MLSPGRWAVLAVVAGLLAAGSANAWQRYFTSQGMPLRWPASPTALRYSVDDTGLAADGLGLGAVGSAIQGAFAVWQAVACPICPPQTAATACRSLRCGDRPLGLTVSNLGFASQQPIGLACAVTGQDLCTEFQPDGNQVLFIHDAKDWPYGSNVIAMTVISVKPDTGFIADADIAVNDAGFAFCLDDCAIGQVHLGAAILHEAGHFLGLDHSQEQQAVMFATAPKTVPKQGALQNDDMDGVCAVYPEEATVTTCQPATNLGTDSAPAPGCTTVAAGSKQASGGPATGTVLAVVLGLRAVRRSRPARPPPGSTLASPTGL